MRRLIDKLESPEVGSSRGASFPQEDVSREMEDRVSDDHEDDVEPEVALVEVVALQHLVALGEAR